MCTSAVLRATCEGVGDVGAFKESALLVLIPHGAGSIVGRRVLTDEVW